MNNLNVVNKSVIMLFILSLSSCQLIKGVFINEKKAQVNAAKLDSSLSLLRDRVYGQVKVIKLSPLKNSDSTKYNSLVKQYGEVATKFNSIYNRAYNSVDSNVVNGGKCLVYGYKRIILPLNSELEQASEDADRFITASTNAISGASSGGFITFDLIAGIVTQLAKKKIQICKDDIKKRKFESWAAINPY